MMVPLAIELSKPAPPRSRSRADIMGKVLVDTSEVAWHALHAHATAGRALGASEAAALRARGAELFDKEVKAWEAAKLKTESGDDRYMKQVLKSGTLADKVAAMTLLVGESPVHRLSTLDGLLAMAKSGRHTSKMAIESLKDFFAGEGLPDGRRLLRLEDRGAAAASASPAALVCFVFEERLADRFGEFLGVVEGYLKHQAKELRRFAAETCQAMLRAKPEREARLLAMLVNKLGDPEPSVGGRASQLLLELLKAHRAMTPVVAAEVQAFATRAGNGRRALYAAVSFLNQLFLSSQLADLAASLVAMYVALFSAAVQAGELQTKLLAALLTGVNRALPYAPGALGAESEKEVDALFGLSHAGTFSTRVQALALLDKLAATGDGKLRARYLRSLYAAVSCDDARKQTKPALLLNLVFRAASAEGAAAPALLKRLLSSAAHGPAPVAAAGVFLASKVLRGSPKLAADLVVDAPAAETPDAWRDALKRDPAYAGAGSKLWELAALRTHYHPSVRKFAAAVQSEPRRAVDYGGDPLADLSLQAFLDRFAYRNPKKAKKRAHARDAGSAPSTARDVADAADGAVAPEDAFYRRYFAEKKAKPEARRAVDDEFASDDDDDAEADDEDADRAGNFALASDGEASDDGSAEGLPVYDSDGADGAEGLPIYDSDGADDDLPTGLPIYDSDGADEEDESEEEDDDDDDDDEEDDDDDAMFGGDDEDEDEDEEVEVAPPPKAQKKDKASRKRSPFMSADDYLATNPSGMDSGEEDEDAGEAEEKPRRKKTKKSRH